MPSVSNEYGLFNSLESSPYQSFRYSSVHTSVNKKLLDTSIQSSPFYLIKLKLKPWEEKTKPRGFLTDFLAVH